ncbi:MAG TPA: transcription-repair coupling factor [Planctomycetota bacterium]|nr:transcription-repair coupling factor [Planctomycetota bacterium]HRR80313.1 transcription-repair coupling factor [Planctomycetota bacterium]
MASLISRLQGDERLRRLVRRLATGRGGAAGGLWGSSVACFLAALSREAGRPLLVVAPSVEAAEELTEDLRLFTADFPTLFPAWETAPGESPFPGLAQSQRLGLLRRLCKAGPEPAPRIVVAAVQALLQPVPSPEAVARSTLTIRVGERHTLETLAEWLVERGLRRVPMVETAGEFSVRGGILDLFALATAKPCRIEFFGDEVESIRTFDIETQRSDARLESCEVVALSGRQVVQATQGAARSLADFLPADAWVCVHEPLEVQQRAERAAEQLGASEELLGFDSLYSALSRRPILHTQSVYTGAEEGAETFDVHSTQGFDGQLASIVAELDRLTRSNDVVAIFCANAGERERLQELLKDADFPRPERLEYREGFLSAGFEFRDLRFACVGHHEIFNRYAQRRRPGRRATAPVESFLDLERGDTVVHVSHGIARFRGMERLNRRGELEDFLTLEFADNVLLYVPATKIDLVQKYVGSLRVRPTLSKLGGTQWETRKAAVREAVRDLAQDLLHVQAIRSQMPGIPYPPDDPLVAEFERAFPYTETPDQLTASDEIKADMEKPRPMDRLLCGDVGYGKTELAMRAAFKAVAAGKQVAVLVPTTVLAQQHFRTFRERFADYPVVVEVLSRFRSPAEQREVLRRAAEGGVDILIGTHRLLSGDVRFRDLGLVVVDEEQRFGVEHKERLKRLRATVDILTMTATPIPRTLHMALLGIRDISALNTPPQDRLTIRTRVCRPSPDLIRDAILREMARDGQVFFVHNRVYNIEEVAHHLRALVPEARFIIGHGQMNEHELEEHMTRFVNGEADVLVSTTIIESGLDIPRANTLFVNNADQFGLAELHQLRGRVGRYKHRAYAYFLVSPEKPLTQVALHRLKAIEEFDELGAGFRIAMRDLEIRGSGNILGVEQSGHIAAIGYDLYCKLLEASVKELRHEPVVERVEVDVDIDLNAYLPIEYIPDDAQRMQIYRKLAHAATLEELAAVGDEMADRYGACPEPVRKLLARHELRIYLEPFKITSVARRKGYLLVRYLDRAKLAERFASLGNRQVRVLDDTTAHVILPVGLTEPLDIVAWLRRLFGGPA